VLFKQLNKLFCFIFLVILSSAATADADISNKKATKLAVVNISTLMRDSPRAKSLGEEIKNKFLPKEEALTKEAERLKELEESLDKDTSKQENNADRIKSSRAYRERKRQYTRDFEAFQDQLGVARQDALVAVRQEVQDAIATVREKYSIDIVIDNYISASDSVDITQTVIQYLEKKYQEEQSLTFPQSQVEEKLTK